MNYQNNMGRISAVTRSYIFLIREYLHVHNQTKARIKNEINLGKTNLGPFLKNHKIRNRIEQYTNFCQLLGQAVCTLYGRKMSIQEETRFFYLSLLGPIFDDFFDNKSLKPGTISSMIVQPGNHEPSSSTEEISIHYLKKIYLLLPNPEDFQKASLELFKAQIESMKQSDPMLSAEKIKFISLEKGGLTGNLYRLLIDHPPGEGEDDVFYYVGMVGQYVDDIFDYYDDWKDGIRNAANCLEDMALVRTGFEQIAGDSIKKIRQLPCPTENIDQFLNLLNILISPTWICLDKFDNLKEKYGDKFSMEHIQRKEMICDMEKWNNRISMYFKSIHHYPGIIG